MEARHKSAGVTDTERMLADPKPLMNRLDHRCQAIGRARRR